HDPPDALRAVLSDLVRPALGAEPAHVHHRAHAQVEEGEAEDEPERPEGEQRGLPHDATGGNVVDTQRHRPDPVSPRRAAQSDRRTATVRETLTVTEDAVVA